MFISFCLLDPEGFDPEDDVLFCNLNPEALAVWFGLRDPEGLGPERLCLCDPEDFDPEDRFVLLCVCFIACFYFMTS